MSRGKEDQGSSRGNSGNSKKGLASASEATKKEVAKKVAKHPGAEDAIAVAAKAVVDRPHALHASN